MTSATPPLIEVVGSLNIDLVTVTPRVPSGGETVTATSFSTGFGGKGANQAVSCSRLLRDAPGGVARGGVRVRMIGAVGDDEFGRDMRHHLQTQEGIEVEGVEVVPGTSTGTAVILVEQESGENRILVTPGANEKVEAGKVVLEEGVKGGVVLFQLETPLETVVQCIRKAKELGKKVVLNPAPAIELPEEVYHGLDSLIMNEHEAAILSGIDEDRLPRSLEEAAANFIRRGVINVVITLGREGVYKKSKHDEKGIHIEAHNVVVRDTTAAGDTFVGGYVVEQVLAGIASRSAQTSIDTDHSMQDIEFANKAASKAVQRDGASSSMPFRKDV